MCLTEQSAKWGKHPLNLAVTSYHCTARRWPYITLCGDMHLMESKTDKGREMWQRRWDSASSEASACQSPPPVKNSSPAEKPRQVCLHKLNHTAIQKRTTDQKTMHKTVPKGLDICVGMSGTSISVISRLLFAVKKWISYHNSKHMSANIWGFSSENWWTDEKIKPKRDRK